MRDDICTIPVSETFEQNDGCPICRMYNTLQERIVDYIMGAAMMEPDVRIATNKVGFCEKHFGCMLGKRGRLPLALMLESHIDHINKNVLANKIFEGSKTKIAKAKSVAESCFVCEKIEWSITRMLATIYRCYENEKDFRELFNNQSIICLPHYELLLSGADKRNMHSHYKEFCENLYRITGEYSKTLHEDVKKFCSMYDYRNNTKDADWGNSKDSVERTISFLTGMKIE